MPFSCSGIFSDINLLPVAALILLSFPSFAPDRQRQPCRNHEAWSTRPFGNDKAVYGDLPAPEKPEKMEEGDQREEKHSDGCEWFAVSSLPYLE